MKHKFSILAHYFLGYQIVYPFLLVIIAQVLIPQQLASGYLPSWYQFSFYLFFLMGILYLCKDFIQTEWIQFRTTIKYKKWFKQLLFFFLLIYLSNILLSILLSFITPQDTSVNQEALQLMLTQTPILTISVALVFAPLVEEIIFRGILFNLFKKHGFIIAALISSLLFGFIHILPNSIGDLPFVFVYATMGWIIAYSYHKTGNIFTAITLHFINNLVAIIGMLLV